MEPTTIMTCIQVASSVASMLAPKGPSVSDLIAIQTEMLKNISNQINTLQKGVDIIMRKVDELKNYVEYDLPSDIYQEFVENNLLGDFAGYQEEINAYLNDRVDMGCYPALEQQKSKLILILQRIQTSRRQLLNTKRGKDYFLAPLIANCFKIEIDLMIMLYKDFTTKGNFISTFNAYESWLNEMQKEDNIYSVDFNITKLKSAYDSCFPNIFGYTICKSVDNHRSEVKLLNQGHDDYYDIQLNVAYYQFKRVLHPSISNELAKYNLIEDDILNMYNCLNIDKIYLPTILSQTIETKIKEENLNLHFHDDYYKGIPQDGDPPYVRKTEYYNPILDISRNDLYGVKKCEIADGKIFTNKKYFEATKNIENLAQQIIIPISNKKIMFDIQNKINFLKLKLN